MLEIKVDDILTFKKAHPWGYQRKVKRTGGFKIEVQPAKLIMIPRVEALKKIKKKVESVRLDSTFLNLKTADFKPFCSFIGFCENVLVYNVIRRISFYERLMVLITIALFVFA